MATDNDDSVPRRCKATLACALRLDPDCQHVWIASSDGPTICDLCGGSPNDRADLRQEAAAFIAWDESLNGPMPTGDTPKNASSPKSTPAGSESSEGNPDG